MTTKNENKQNVNENVKANNVNNESANESANNANNESNESKQILIDVTLESDTYKIKHAKEINERYKSEEPQQHESDKWQHGKLCAIYRPKANRVNSDKTFYKIEYNGIIFDGYTNTDFCDANGIPRSHRGSNTPKVVTLLDKLQALKNAIEAIGSEDEQFTKFAKIVASKIESEKLESERAAFLAKYEMVVGLFDMITEATFAKKYNSDDLALALKLGYKFSDTKQDTKQDTKESK